MAIPNGVLGSQHAPQSVTSVASSGSHLLAASSDPHALPALPLQPALPPDILSVSAASQHAEGTPATRFINPAVNESLGQRPLVYVPLSSITTSPITYREWTNGNLPHVRIIPERVN